MTRKEMKEAAIELIHAALENLENVNDDYLEEKSDINLRCVGLATNRVCTCLLAYRIVGLITEEENADFFSEMQEINRREE